MKKWRFILSHPIIGTISTFPEPIGWDKITKTITRDLDTAGAIFKFSAELKFRCEAYDFIKAVYQLEGIEAEATFTALYRCQPEDAERVAFYGRLNFGTLRFDATVMGASCNIEATDPLIELESRKDLSVDLLKLTSVGGQPLNDYVYAPYEMTLHPKTIVKKTEYQKVDFANEAGSSYQEDQRETKGIAAGTDPGPHLTGSIWTRPHWDFPIYTELDTYVGQLDDSGAENNDGSGPTPTPTFIATEDGLYHVKTCFCFDYNVGYLLISGIPDDMHFFTHVYLRLGANVIEIYNSGDQTVPSGISQGVDFSNICVNIDETGFVFAGEEITIYFECGWSTNTNRQVLSEVFLQVNFRTRLLVDTVCNLEISSSIQKQKSQAKVFMVNEALARVVESITDNKLTVISDYLGRPDSQPFASPSGELGCGSLTAITNGFALRQFIDPITLLPKELFTSFGDMFSSLSAVYGLGYGVEYSEEHGRYVLRVEPIEYFYQETVIASFDNVNHRASKWLREVSPDMHVSILNVGYEKWESEGSNGLDEVLSKRQYINHKLTKISNSVDKISKYIGSGYAIEITRSLQFYAEPTTDFKYDNDCFLIRVNGEEITVGSDVYPRYFANDRGVVTATAANLIDPSTVTNWPITPYYNALRWASIWGLPIFDFNPVVPDDPLKFASANGNYKARGESSNAWNFCDPYNSAFLHSENDNLDGTKSKPPKLRPEIVTFQDFPIEMSQFEVIEANPHKMLLIVNEWAEAERFFVRELVYNYRNFTASFTLMPAR